MPESEAIEHGDFERVHCRHINILLGVIWQTKQTGRPEPDSCRPNLIIFVKTLRKYVINNVTFSTSALTSSKVISGPDFCFRYSFESVNRVGFGSEGPS